MPHSQSITVWAGKCQSGAAEVPVKYLQIGLSVFLALATLATLAGGQNVTGFNSVENAFEAGRSVSMRLSSGDYTIRAGSPDRIVVRWEPETPSDGYKMKKIKVKLDVSGSEATIRTDGP